MHMCYTPSYGTYFALLGLILFATLYAYMKYVYGYWTRRGIATIKPAFPFGNVGDCLTLKTDLGNVIKLCHQKINGKFAGIFMIMRPTLLVKDRKLLEHILIKDFDYFCERDVFFDEKKDPLWANLFCSDYNKWLPMRSKLASAFTIGKLIRMFSTFRYINYKLERYIDNMIEILNNEIEVRDLAARYLTDIIASVAFGIEVDSINEPLSVFRVMSAKAIEPTFKNLLVNVLSFMAPKLLKFINLKQTDDDVEEFMFSVVRQTIRFREKNNYTREDFMQILIQLRNGVNIENSDEWNTDIVNDSLKRMSIQEIAAQCFIFLVAGFETSSCLVSFCLYELAKHQQYLKMAQRDIDETLRRFNNEITYESVAAIQYLDLCIDETLRKYPPIPFLQRICNKDYKIPGTDKTIEKGICATISILGIHYDPKIYPKPEVFDPSRFEPQNRAKLSSVDFLPYGEGPRNCIGMKFGHLISKIGLITMLSKYDIEFGTNMNGGEILMDPRYLLMLPSQRLNLRFSKRSF